MNGLGPNFGRSFAVRPAPTAITALTGRKARPAWIGLKPSTICTKRVRKKNMPKIAQASMSMIP